MKRLFLFLFGIFMLELVSGTTIFFDDFESGNLNAWNRTNVAGAANWTANQTNPFVGSWHAQSRPTSTTEPASVLQINISTLGYQNITFMYYKRLVGIDAADEFQAEWFNGTTWTIVEQTGGSTADNANYLFSTFNLTASSNNNTNFGIKFECTAGAVSEFCRVDNVTIGGDLIPDSTAPVVYLKNPANSTITKSNNLFFSTNFTDNVGLLNASLYLWNNTDLISINSTTLSGLAGIANLSLTLPRDGTYFWNYLGTDSSNNMALNHTNFTLSLDTTSPSITGFTEFPADPATYAVNQQYQFNATITDNIALQTVRLEFNGTNYTASNLAGNLWNVTLVNLPAGVFSYYWFANDTIGNVNATETGSYTINRAGGSIALLLNSTAGNLTLIYPSQVNASITSSTGQTIQLLRNGTDITSDNAQFRNLSVLSLGIYNFTALALENQNYTQVSIQRFIDLQKGTPSGTLTITPSLTVSYPTSTTTTGSESNFGDGDLAYTLYRNNVSVSNPETITLAAGTYAYIYNTTTGQNWTSNSTLGLQVLTVNQETGDVRLFLNHTRANITEEVYNRSIQINASLFNGQFGSLNLTENNAQINFSDFLNLTAVRNYTSLGDFNITIRYSGNTNYTADSEQWFITVRDSTPPNITGLIESPTDPSTYLSGRNYVFNATITDNFAMGIVLIQFDNVNYTVKNSSTDRFNFTISNLAAGTYNYLWRANDTSGNVQVSTLQTYTVNRSSSVVNLTFNETEGNITINAGQIVSINGTRITSDSSGTLELYRNRTLINVGISNKISNVTNFSSAGYFNFTVFYRQSENYTESFKTYFVNVTPIVDAISPTFTTIPANTSSSYPRGFGVDFDAADETQFDSFRINWTNTFLINQSGFLNNTRRLDASFYIINVSINDSSGNSNYVFYTVNITQNNTYVINLTLSPSSTVTYPTSTTAAGTQCPTELSCILFRNNVSISNPETITLGAGSYHYIFNTTGNTNYSSNTISNLLTVNQEIGDVRLFLNHTRNNITLKQGESINVNGTLFAGQFGFLNLTQNGLQLNFSSSTNLTYRQNFSALGSFNITVRYINNSNYTTDSEQWFITVVDTTAPSLIVISPQNITYTNETILINITSDGDYIWFYNGTGNESYNSPVYKAFPEGNNNILVYTNDSSGNLNSTSIIFNINVPILRIYCETGGPYQQDALVIAIGNVSNSSSMLPEKNVNLSIYNSSNLAVLSKILITASDGSFETNIPSLTVGLYNLNASVTNVGLNSSCIDSFQLGFKAVLALDKIASVYSLTNSSIIYNITLILTNIGGANALNVNISDSDSSDSIYNIGILLSNSSIKRSYLKNLTRKDMVDYQLTVLAITEGIDSYSNSLISANSTVLNLTIPATAVGKQIVITKNVLFKSEGNLNVSYNISSTLYNSGDEDLTGISYIDSDINNSVIILNLTKGSSRQFSNLVIISKAASNTQHEFALGTATINLLNFYSNRPKVNIPGYGGPADIIVYAPSSVQTSTPFNSIIEIKNVNLDIGQDFPIDYWITNDKENQNYSSGQKTVYVGANNNVNTSVSLTAPNTIESYKLKALTSWAGGTASSFDSFEVIGSQTDSGGAGTSGSVGREARDANASEKVKEVKKEDEIICNKPYIRYGKECCLDTNNNLICDEDEIKEKLKEVDEPEKPSDIISTITGFIARNITNIKVINKIAPILLIVILILLVILVMYLIRKKKKAAGRLSQLKGLKVYTNAGNEIGKINGIILGDNKIDSFNIKLSKKIRKMLKIKTIGINVKYKYIEGVKNIVIINEKIIENVYK